MLATVSLLGLACGDSQPLRVDLEPESPAEDLDDLSSERPADPCDGRDNDVDGTVDGGCYCIAGEVQSCFPGDHIFAGVGSCEQLGTQTCLAQRGDFPLGRWSECLGATTPTIEICGNAQDEDCDGFTAPCQGDDVIGLPCYPGARVDCYDGPPGTQGIGQCSAGTRFCGEFGAWGSCEGASVPTAEICGNERDENCDGADLTCEPQL